MRGEIYTGFGRGNVKQRDGLKDFLVNGRIILNRISKKWEEALDLDLTGSSYEQCM
jgi:hypothetical protein